jgi:hypothetical protein
MDPSGKASAAATLSRSGVSGLISSRDGRVVRFIVPVPVGLPPARALTGEAQSQDRQVPDGLPWRGSFLRVMLRLDHSVNPTAGVRIGSLLSNT